MANFGSILKNLRTSRGITQGELATMLDVSRSTVGMYETGGREPDFETMEAIADIFNVDMDYLMGRTQVERKHPISPPRKEIPPGFQPLPEMMQVPLIGTIACGTPILAEENLDGTVEAPDHVRADFALRCKGDSMINARIFDGDIVYIRQQESVEHGEIAAVLIGDEATLKRVYIYDDCISLEAENPQYKPMVYRGEEMNNIRILGKAVAFTSVIR